RSDPRLVSTSGTATRGTEETTGAPHAERKGTPRTVLVLVGCLALLLLAVLASLALGSKVTSLAEVVGALTGEADPYLATVLDARTERTLLAIGVGAALALSGALM